MRKTDKSPLGYYTIGIAALFLAGFLLLIVFGAHCFRDAVAGQNDNMRTRAVLSYLATSVKANDTYNAVSVRDSAYGPVLVIEDGTSGYALRIYSSEGNLVEDFAQVDDELSPEKGQIIGAAETFAVEEVAAGVFSVDTDEGRVLFHVRSREGGAS